MAAKKRRKMSKKTKRFLKNLRKQEKEILGKLSKTQRSKMFGR